MLSEQCKSYIGFDQHLLGACVALLLKDTSKHPWMHQRGGSLTSRASRSLVVKDQARDLPIHSLRTVIDTFAGLA